MTSSAKKQGTLFSFFSKKPSSSTSSNAKASPKTAAAKAKSISTAASSKKIITSSSPIQNSNTTKKSSNGKALISSGSNKKQELLLASIQVGSAISVFWPADQEYYNAKVTAKNRKLNASGTSNVFTLLYEDGEVETIDLTNEKFKIEDTASPKRAASSVKKRKTIQESDEEEFEFDDEVEDEEESEDEFVADEEESEEEFDAMDVTDEDDEEIAKGRNGKANQSKKRPLATSLRTSPTYKKRSTGGKVRATISFITPPPKATSKPNAFASFASDSSVKQTAKTDRVIHPVSQLTPTPPASGKKTSSTKANIPFPQNGVVNQAGTHLHNHFKFLLPDQIRDAQGRPKSHPEYDPRTMKVDFDDIERVMSKVTPAMQQWWEIKAQYADTLLLFKTGKFYEIFHMDADVAVQVLGFSYMKGQKAHAGFPEIGYGNFMEKLVRAGYKVARVEQTETPDMLKERKQNTRKGLKKPMVVNREVCSIVSSGTRTFCYMDDIRGLDGDNAHSGIGPLLVIKEITLNMDQSSSDNDDDDDDSVQPVCEYGVTLVDAATGAVTLGQFADDILRGRMNTLLTKYRPSEILVQNGPEGASKTLVALLNSMKNTILPSCIIGNVNCTEIFPRSNALDPEIRLRMQRTSSEIKPWDQEQTIAELHRRGYYPRASKNKPESCPDGGIGRWPDVLKACVTGGADLALSSFGAALFYLQRNMIDAEILSMGDMKAYIPPDPAATNDTVAVTSDRPSLNQLASEEQRLEDGTDASARAIFVSQENDKSAESEISHLSLDGTTLANLEILTNLHSNTVAGSLWSKINFTKSPFGSRLLRAWLLRPLFQKADIDRRADAVEELVSGAAAAAMSEARDVLGKCGDMERLLSRVHSMGGNGSTGVDGDHPNERAVLYEAPTHTRRKVGDFSKLLNGLRAISQIPEIFDGIEIKSGLLNRIVKSTDNGGLFPSKLNEHLDWFFENFDCKKAAEGHFEPSRGIDDDFDEACDAIDRIKQELDDYKNEMCSGVLKPSHLAKREWKYTNIKVDSKDKFLIELPINVQVPSDFIVKGKRGKGAKQVNKYQTPFVERLVEELENAYDVMKGGKARGMQLIFAKFDSMRSLWASAAQASAMIDALGSLAKASAKAGNTRPIIKTCPSNGSPSMNIVQGRHPCVDFTHSGDNFIPNDLTMGGEDGDDPGAKILLLSGPNMGGKSTLLRQTCLIAILAQIGCFVPAEECTITPFDRIFTRLGASDRILLGQSTFFVELAETAAALRGATRRSLVIMDELGRGTSTFDGTAIASAAVKHLVESNQCLTLFATHYHSLLEDWKDKPAVRLGHMECFVDEKEHNVSEDTSEDKESNITFLYTLGEGGCPKSFGINVARLAGLPEEVLEKAKYVSASFEESMNNANSRPFDARSDSIKLQIQEAIAKDKWEDVDQMWESLQG